MYANGQGVAQDYAEALKWYRKAADQGNAKAQNNLGERFRNGQGVAQDYAEAMQWYRKAADQGAAVAQFNIGEMYMYGQGVARDYVRAYTLFNLAAERLPTSDLKAEAVKNRNNVATKMTTAQIAQAQKLAREPKPQ